MKLELTLHNFSREIEVVNGTVSVLKSEGDMSIEGYYTVAEAAEILGRSERRVRQLIANGGLRTVKIGQVNLILVGLFEKSL